MSQGAFFDGSFPNSSFILPPSYFPRVPLAVPYWNGATYRGMLRAILTGSAVQGADVERFRSLVLKTLCVEDAIPCGSGSLALEIALRACGAGDGDEVVIPTFCCTAVVPPILAAGARPVFADVGEELNITAKTVEAELTKKTKAVVVPHLFGNPADIEAIMDLARARHIGVIDDAAQALGATVGGRPVGSFGDAGVFSFGAEKVCAGLGGGVVVSRNKEFLHGRKEIDLPIARLAPSLRALSSTLVWRRWRRWTFPVQGILSHRNAEGPNASPAPYRIEAMANLNAAVALSLMRTLGGNIAARRARVDAYRELLGAEGGLALIPHRPGSACLTQVVQFLPKGRGVDLAMHVVEALNGAGYEVQGSYVPIHVLPRFRQWCREALTHAERVWSDLIELPCEPSVSFAQVDRIATIVRRFVNS